eukprot:COSAG02_NODE_8635_length_2497_cov_2.471030_3_plen_52_part_00
MLATIIGRGPLQHDVASGLDARTVLIYVHDKGQCAGAPSKGVKGMKKGFLL